MNRRTFLKASAMAGLVALLPLGLQAEEIKLPSGLYVVSFYGSPSDGFGRDIDKRLTANGELFNPQDYTCAHRTLPFNTRVRVVNSNNKKEVFVRVNDRGPFTRGREIDVSYIAAQELNFVKEGTLLAYIEMVPMSRAE